MAKREIVTAASGNVVSIATLAEHLRIDAREEDVVLGDLLSEAVAAVEEYTRRRLLTQTWDESFDRFANPLVLSETPVQSVTSVTYIDSNGELQTLSADIWEFAYLDGQPCVRRKYDQDWPSVRSHKDVVIVRYVAGYGDSGDVPDSLSKAVRVHAAWNHRHREGEAVPDGFFRLLAPYKRRHV